MKNPLTDKGLFSWIVPAILLAETNLCHTAGLHRGDYKLILTH